jgi:hypothetical protein
LDHPRLIDKGHAFAIRTLFWWGHYFSVTLHLSGKFKAQYQNKIAGQYPQLKQHEIYINANDREWEHDLDGNDYLLIKNLEQGEWKSHVEAIPFIKLAKKFPLEMWDNAPGQLAGDFSLLLAMTGD